MALFFQIGAVLMAGVVVATAWTTRPAPDAIARSIGVVAIAFAYIAFWGHVWDTGKSFWDQRAQWKTFPPAQAAIVGAPAEPGFQKDFAEWIRQRLRPGDRFYLVPSATRDEAVYQWFTYRLTPNLAVEKPERADWLIFYGTTPRESGFIHHIRGIAEQFGPGYSIARAGYAS